MTDWNGISKTVNFGSHMPCDTIEDDFDAIVQYHHTIGCERITINRNQLDVLWSRVAGHDPVAQIEAFGDRLKSIHLKDGLLDGTELPFGLGQIDLPAIVCAAKARDMTIVAKSETLSPSGLEEARICIAYLKNLES